MIVKILKLDLFCKNTYILESCLKNALTICQRALGFSLLPLYPRSYYISLESAKTEDCLTVSLLVILVPFSPSEAK